MNSLILDIALSAHVEIGDYAHWFIKQISFRSGWPWGVLRRKRYQHLGECQYRDCGSCEEGRIADSLWVDLQVWLFDHGGIGHAWCRLPVDSVSVLDRLQPIVTRSNKRMC